MGVIIVDLIPGAPIMVGGTRYQIGITNDMFGNVTVAKTCCDMKPCGGNRNGVLEMA